MNQSTFRWILLSLPLVLGLLANAQSSTRLSPADFKHVEYTVDGAAREALIYAPKAATDQPRPLVFVFHGHGGSSRQVARSIEMAKYWPEAISVYMQGLNTPGRLTDPEGRKAGWQANAGDQGDRDLKFFDAVLLQVKRDYQVDEKRIYATGHSNGGGFTYLLWAERGEVFAAVAPSAAVARYVDKLEPKPTMHLAGEKDALVKYQWQLRMMDTERGINGCSNTGTNWDDHCTLYPSTNGTPFVTFTHPGGHEFDRTATPKIVRFFKEHPAP